MADAVALILRFLHILSGVGWIGGVAFSVAVLRVAMARVDMTARKAAMRELIPRALQYIPGSALMTIVTGALLYGWLGAFDPSYLLGSAWGLVLLTALVLALTAFTIGMVFSFRMGRALLVHLREEACTHGPEVGSLQKGFNRSQFVVLGLGFAIIALMVVATTHALG